MSDADTGVAERMIDLFSGSLPASDRNGGVAYDYYRLIQSREEDELFGRYDVKLLIGAMDPGFEGIPFLAIGDMITAEGLGRIDAALSGGLDAAELDAFNKNLLKDFSLLNVVKHLTILNPEKLMGYVQEAVTRLRGITGKRFSNRVTIALYIHISCLIERLITRTPIEQYPETEGFLREKERFVAQVKEGVPLPDEPLRGGNPRQRDRLHLPARRAGLRGLTKERKNGYGWNTGGVPRGAGGGDGQSQRADRREERAGRGGFRSSRAWIWTPSMSVFAAGCARLTTAAACSCWPTCTRGPPATWRPATSAASGTSA